MDLWPQLGTLPEFPISSNGPIISSICRETWKSSSTSLSPLLAVFILSPKYYFQNISVHSSPPPLSWPSVQAAISYMPPSRALLWIWWYPEQPKPVQSSSKILALERRPLFIGIFYWLHEILLKTATSKLNFNDVDWNDIHSEASYFRCGAQDRCSIFSIQREVLLTDLPSSTLVSLESSLHTATGVICKLQIWIMLSA